MPNIKGAMKAMRQSKSRREYNLVIKENVKKSVKDVKRLIKEGKKTEAADLMKKAMSALDKAAKKNVLHKNNAARRKSRLAKALGK